MLEELAGVITLFIETLEPKSVHASLKPLGTRSSLCSFLALGIGEPRDNLPINRGHEFV